MQSLIRLSFILLFSQLLIDCARTPLKEKTEALRPTEQMEIQDTLSVDSLIQALKQNIKYLQPKNIDGFQMGPYNVPKAQMIKAQSDLLTYLEANGAAKISDAVKVYFDFLEVYGQDSWGQVFVTSYFDPIIKGSKKPTKIFTQPIYRLPPDLVTIQLDQFLDRFPNLNLKPKEEQKSNGALLRGRLISASKKGESPVVVPYYNREEIDQSTALKGKKLEIVWVDPIDSFFLQIQGSGRILLGKDKELRVGYAGQNGYRYEAIGKFLKDKIPLEDMTMHTIETYLRTLPTEEIQKILNQNPSYVFFRELDSKSITFLGSEVVGGRTIATDHRFFAKGTLAYLEIETPIFEGDSLKPAKFESKPRLVIDQDTGGAIRGGGRVDLYWGEGDEAKKFAGVMKQNGKLHYLIPKGIITK
jgi:membrane-bound lytic murein transglycosylase A